MAVEVHGVCIVKRRQTSSVGPTNWGGGRRLADSSTLHALSLDVVRIAALFQTGDQLVHHMAGELQRRQQLLLSWTSRAQVQPYLAALGKF
jgi:hypothetical protein